MQGALISSIDPVNTKHKSFQDKYLYSEVYWDTSCNASLSTNFKLFFIHKSVSACEKVSKNNVTFILVTHDNFRSSSALYDHMKIENLLQLETNVKRSGALFSSQKKIGVDNISKYLSCTNSSDIYVTPGNETKNQPKQKFVSKTMDENGQIKEQLPVIINGYKKYVTINCSTIPSNFNFIAERNTLAPDNQYQDFNKVCCLNSTHSVKTYGDCSDISFPSI